MNARRRHEETPGVGVRRPTDNNACRPLLNDPTCVHDGQAVGEARHHRQVMCDVNGRSTIGPNQLSDRVEHVALGGHVQPGCGLVEDNDPRVTSDRHGNAYPLLLTPR